LQVVTLEGSLALSRELLREQMQRMADGGGGGGGGEMDMPPDGAAEAAFAAPWAPAPSDAHSSHMQRVRGLPPSAAKHGHPARHDHPISTGCGGRWRGCKGRRRDGGFSDGGKQDAQGAQ
jgi:hypothetical protein